MTSPPPSSGALPPAGPLSQDDDLLAAEYVLGVLDSEARAQVEIRVRRDAAFALAVTEWENRLAGLNDEFDPVPAPNLMPQIEARLFPAAPATPHRGRRWFGMALGAVLAAGVVAALLVAVLPPQAPHDRLLTTLAAAGLAYEVRSDGTTLQVIRTAGTAAPAGQTHELWIIAPGAAPVSLGLLAEAPLRVVYPAPPAGWTLAVSVEPAGGSPTGAPTGPVILAQEIGV